MFFTFRKKIKVDFNNLHLIEPCEHFRKDFKQAVKEHKRHNVEDFYYPSLFTKKQFLEHLQELKDRKHAHRFNEGVIPSTAFWLTDGNHYLGSGEIRHYLNENLKTFGGHIGYSIRPAVWNQGIGTKLLSLLLTEAKKMGIKTARITCFDENIASAKVMEKNNAVFMGTAINNIRGEERLTRIYDIEL